MLEPSWRSEVPNHRLAQALLALVRGVLGTQLSASVSYTFMKFDGMRVLRDIMMRLLLSLAVAGG